MARRWLRLGAHILHRPGQELGHERDQLKGALHARAGLGIRGMQRSAHAGANISVVLPPPRDRAQLLLAIMAAAMMYGVIDASWGSALPAYEKR